VLTFGEWPYGDRLVAVWTSRELTQPPGARVQRVSGDARCVADALIAAGVSRVYVDGGRAVQSFLDAGLIRRLIVTRIPVLIGRGIPLFGPTSADIALRHVRTETFPSGFVQSEYVIPAR
jgi:dihydrofolate reductase